MHNTLEGYIYSLKNLSSRIEQLDVEIPFSLVKEIENIIKNLIFIPLVFRKRIPSFERLTINKKVIGVNQRIYHTDQLRYPPERKIKTYGRCNLIGQSVLYGTFATPTAIDELQPDIGDIITISIWEEKEIKEELIVYPVFRNRIDEPKNLNLKNEYFKYLSNFTLEKQKLIDSQQEFISSCFTKRVNKNYNRNYLISANLANKILNELASSETDAIIYPSVKDPLKMDNIVLKKESANSKYRITRVTEYRVIKNNSGLKVLDLIKHTNKIENNIIDWDFTSA